jgi:hypothetical protein
VSYRTAQQLSAVIRIEGIDFDVQATTDHLSILQGNFVSGSAPLRFPWRVQQADLGSEIFDRPAAIAQMKGLAELLTKLAAYQAEGHTGIGSLHAVLGEGPMT